jgi:hypothetical protein
MFKLIRNFNENGIDLKKGDYSRDDLIKLYEGEERFNYCFTCTSLKDALIEVTEEDKSIVEKIIETVATPQVEYELEEQEIQEEDKLIEFETVFVAKENIKKGKKIVIKKDQVVMYSELTEIFGEELDNSVFNLLIETKVKKDVSI